MRHKKLAIAAALLATGLMTMAPAATATPVATATPATGCATVYWGSLSKTATTNNVDTIHNVRTGQHNCFDRLVVDLNGDAVGYTVKYVNTLYEPGSGHPVELDGGAMLSITLDAPAYDSWGDPTYIPAAKVSTLNYATFKQLAYLGSYEGQTDFALSTRARLPMRVFTLDGPGNGSRLVIDVAHYWY